MEVLKKTIKLRKKRSKIIETAEVISIKPFANSLQMLSIIEIDGKIYIQNNIRNLSDMEQVRQEYVFL
jgi:hypothetical protein